jgi:hypothetical protein
MLMAMIDSVTDLSLWNLDKLLPPIVPSLPLALSPTTQYVSLIAGVVATVGIMAIREQNRRLAATINFFGHRVFERVHFAARFPRAYVEFSRLGLRERPL